MIHKVISVDTRRNNNQNATAICQFGDDKILKFSGRAQIIESPGYVELESAAGITIT